jgi:hypothetical protein
MKAILTLLALIFVQQVAASEVTDLRNGDLSLSQASAEIISVRPICPANPGGRRCMAYGSVVSIKVTLNGCLDHMGGYFSRFEGSTLYFGAINIFNKASMTARCVRIPTETVTINVPYEGSIELVDMDFTGMTK